MSDVSTTDDTKCFTFLIERRQVQSVQRNVSTWLVNVATAETEHVGRETRGNLDVLSNLGDLVTNYRSGNLVTWFNGNLGILVT